MQLSTLYLEEDDSFIRLTGGLRRRYGGDLSFPALPRHRAVVIGNFVQSIDGVVSLKLPGKSGGADISGRNQEDTFVMGLLRAVADAVLIGEETFRTAAGHVWTADFIYPELAEEFQAFRRELGKPAPHPINVIVSGAGRVDLQQPLFRRDDVRSLVLTTKQGEEALKMRFGRVLPARVHVLPGERLIRSQDIVASLHSEYGVQCLLHEGGPMLFSSFLAERVVDQLFLTMAPQIVGQGRHRERPAFSGAASFGADDALWTRLVSVKRAATGHLFLCYRFASAP
ncbi:MAG TPA: dihydrofolate reductase family protein [Nitrospira sp.]|nr:dihydrofolate reductase family protein [Nitrospira sp.]